MTHQELTQLTVPELRGLAGEYGLPKYQRAGKRLVKADLVEQLMTATTATYRVQPANEPITVSNGARKWRYNDHGDRVLSAAYCEYEVLKVIGSDSDPLAVRFADPADPSRTWASRYTARDAVARRLLRERQAEQAKSHAGNDRAAQAKRRRLVPSQRQLASMWDGSHAYASSVGV